MSANISQLEAIALELRGLVLKMVHGAKSGHFGGPLSCMEYFVALYFYKMRVDPKNPEDPHRDRFVLSNGHACAGLYASLMQRGFIPIDEWQNFRKLGSPLQGHPKMKLKWGIEMSTGSLGQGMSVANGMALAGKMDGKNYRVYSIETEGTLEEGSTWEGIMTAAHHRLDNRCVLIDWNNVQIDGYTSELKNIEPIDDKFRAFGWHVVKINDGNNMSEVCAALDEAEQIKGKPTAILGRTILGKGVPEFENKPKYHGNPPTDEELKIGLEALTRK